MPHLLPSRKAFTLLELLVVIAILVILSGLIFAAVLRSRDSAKAVTCTNNLRQIGAALATYSAEMGGVMPPHVEVEKDAEQNDTVWSARLVTKGYLPEPTTKKNAIFLCPFDPDAGDDFAEAYRSYAYNAGPEGTKPVYRAGIDDPAVTILLAEWYEPDPAYSQTTHAVWDGEGWGWRTGGGLYKHHADGTSGVLFYDFHVEMVKPVPELPAAGVPYKWEFQVAEPPK